jgi:hypothetical protein
MSRISAEYAEVRSWRCQGQKWWPLDTEAAEADYTALKPNVFPFFLLIFKLNPQLALINYESQGSQ